MLLVWLCGGGVAAGSAGGGCSRVQVVQPPQAAPRMGTSRLLLVYLVALDPRPELGCMSPGLPAQGPAVASPGAAGAQLGVSHKGPLLQVAGHVWGRPQLSSSITCALGSIPAAAARSARMRAGSRAAAGGTSAAGCPETAGAAASTLEASSTLRLLLRLSAVLAPLHSCPTLTLLWVLMVSLVQPRTPCGRTCCVGCRTSAHSTCFLLVAAAACASSSWCCCCCCW